MIQGTLFTEGLQAPEGPSFDSAGNLYVVEMQGGGRVSRIDPEGNRSLYADTGGSPTGSAFGFDGNLYVCNNGGTTYSPGTSYSPEGVGLSSGLSTGWVERLAPDGSIEVIYRHCEGKPLLFPNDIVFDETGNFYFTDSGTFYFTDNRVGTWPDRPLDGKVYWASPDGKMIRLVAEGLNLPNGIGITPDGTMLIVGESVTRKLWAIDILSPGRLGQRREFAELPEPYVPDGFCFDAEGYLICAAPFGGGLLVYDCRGTLVERAELGRPTVSNVAFGGPDFSTLYATAGPPAAQSAGPSSHDGQGQVITVPWHRQGMRLHPDR